MASPTPSWPTMPAAITCRPGQVDMVIVGTDRVTANGDVANKIGTYLKALAAKDNDVPFYVALPSSTIDWTIASGRDIPIEERSPGRSAENDRPPAGRHVAMVEIAAPGSPAANPGFDVTPGAAGDRLHHRTRHLRRHRPKAYAAFSRRLKVSAHGIALVRRRSQGIRRRVTPPRASTPIWRCAPTPRACLGSDPQAGAAWRRQHLRQNHR